MSAASPRVSIGVPVYNGARYLRATIDSLLAQTFTDFELIVCDNASTDETQAICQEYLAKDARVRYLRHPCNLGPAANYNACFTASRGELFKWCAADDVVAPTFVERCVEMLDADPSLVSACSRTIIIDENGREIERYRWELELAHPSAVMRFARLVFVNHRRHNAHEFWGVVRAKTMRDTPLKGSFPSADRILMSWWVLRGKMGRVEEHLLYNREHAERSQRLIPNRDFRPGSRLARYIGGGPAPPYEWWDASTRQRIMFPEWRWVWEYLRAARKTRLPILQKCGILLIMAGLYLKFTPRLARDLIIAAELWITRIPRYLHFPHRPARRPRNMPAIGRRIA